MLSLALLAFVAGILTVAAPCVLPLLPVIVGGSIVRSDADETIANRQWFRPMVIAASLAISVIVFTLLLKATTALLGVPQTVWQVLVGGILVLFGLTLVFPSLWERLMMATGLQNRANAALDRSYRRGGIGGDIVLGAALGPTFSSCSPTYALILATVLPVSFGEGLLYIVIYSIGLAVTLLLVAFVGQALIRRLGWLSNPGGWFRRGVGIALILVGVAVIFGLDKQVQTFVLDQGWYDPIERLEGASDRPDHEMVVPVKHLMTRCNTFDMPTTRPRHLITESDRLAVALDAAARRWPDFSRAQLLVRLALEGDRAVEQDDEERRNRRQDAIRRHSGSFTGTYGAGYLNELRAGWPA